MCEKHVLRFEIAVNHLLAVQEHQTTQHLLCEASNELEREATEIVCFDKFIKIHAKQVSRDAEMSAEVKALIEIDHAVVVAGILVSSQ